VHYNQNPIEILGAAIRAVCRLKKTKNKTGKAKTTGGSFVAPKKKHGFLGKMGKLFRAVDHTVNPL